MAQQKDMASGTAGEAPLKAAEVQQQGRVQLNPANVKSTYCNVCNATSTREEVILNFGINQNWDRGAGPLEVSLEHRIILSPFAAKRLSELLAKLMAEYEARHGELK